MQIEDSDDVNYICPDHDNASNIIAYIKQNKLAHVFWNRNVLASNGTGTVDSLSRAADCCRLLPLGIALSLGCRLA